MLGAVLILAVYVGLILVAAAFVRMHYGGVLAGGVYLAMILGESPGGMLLLLFSFVGLAIGAFATVRLLHDRRAGTIFGPPGIATADFLGAALPVIALNILLLPLVISQPGVEPGLGWGRFALLLVPALIGILVQTGAEEIVFRGYLQQQLAARFSSPLVWMLVPSVMFAAGHYSPEEFGSTAVPIAVWACLFGCLAADLTARTGTLGAAMGFHFATNVTALLLVALFGNLDGLALWTINVNFEDPATSQPLLLLDFLSMVVAWLMARVVLRV